MGCQVSTSQLFQRFFNEANIDLYHRVSIPSSVIEFLYDIVYITDGSREDLCHLVLRDMPLQKEVYTDMSGVNYFALS